MPVIHRSNNRILPPNTRAVDVAQATLRDITPIQQKKYANAFAVAGYTTLVYNLFEAGRPCSCAASRAVLAGRLNQQGKLPKGEINKLITGGHEFKVLPYGVKRTDNAGWIAEQGLSTPSKSNLYKVATDIDEDEDGVDDGNNQPPPFTKIARGLSDDPAAETEQDGGFDAGGPVQDQATIDELDNSPFDAETFELNQISCPVCLGTNFIGGASLVGGWRQMLLPQDVFFSDGVINTLRRPLSMENTRVARWTNITLPKGSWALDALRVWNNNKILPGTVMIDSIPVTSEKDFINFCDGRPHTIDVVFSSASEFTHLEMQTAVSRIPFRLEFPRINENSDLTKLDRTEDVQIYASPELPGIRTRDLIVESTFGKVFQVISGSEWNDQNRQLLGWDMTARVVQPQELYNLLPRRTVSKQKSALLVRDNMSGGKRT